MKECKKQGIKPIPLKKCTHSQIRAKIYNTRIVRRCEACGQFCKVGSKRRADVLLRFIEKSES